MKSVLPLLYALAVIFTVASCTNQTYPAITDTPTNTYQHGTVVWHDLVTKDPVKSAKFYSDVFGWQITKAEGASDYYTIENRGELIGGIWKFPEAGKVDGNEWLGMMSVKSVAEALKKVETTGGSTMVESVNVEGRGELGITVDPSGGIIGLIHAAGGDPEAMEPAENDWLWNELWSNDPESVVPFYKNLGFTFEESDDDGRPYWTMSNKTSKVAGIIKSPIEDYRSVWMPYIRVSDPAAMAKRVERMGGKVMVEPQPDFRNGTVAIALDPLGAPFVLQSWNK